jgi:hypothetical protein
MAVIIQPVLANAGLPFTLFMLGLPFMASIATFGLAGIGIILLEALGIKQLESVPWREAFWTSLRINLFSTILGIGFACLYAASGLLILLIINLCLLTWFLGKLLIRLLVERKRNPQPLVVKFFTYLISLILSLTIFISAGMLNFGIGIKTRFHLMPDTFNLNTYVIATLGLLSLNFLLTWILESYWLTGEWPGKSPAKLCLTVFWINLRSYIYILLPIVIIGGLLQERL